MLQVDPSSATPPFEQVRTQIAALRRTGELEAGRRLPTVRQLAAELGLAPNTIARAYRELEAAGVIETRGRLGSFITGTAESATKAADAAAREFAATVRNLGVAPSLALDLVRRALLD